MKMNCLSLDADCLNVIFEYFLVPTLCFLSFPGSAWECV